MLSASEGTEPATAATMAVYGRNGQVRRQDSVLYAVSRLQGRFAAVGVEGRDTYHPWLAAMVSVSGRLGPGPPTAA